MQTAQQICNTLHLPGMHTYNGIVDVLCDAYGIHQQPDLPTSDVAQYGISVLTYHSEPLPKYPEEKRDGRKRYMWLI